MKVILVGDHATVIDFHVDEIGVDAVDGRAESFEEHGGKQHEVYHCGHPRGVTAISLIHQPTGIPAVTLQSHP